MPVSAFPAPLHPVQGHYLEIPKSISVGNKLDAGSYGKDRWEGLQ